MARKTQITKEIILEAALNMLIRDGYSSINIKTLAKEIGCSTQPIVWHFQNMDGFRNALSEYARQYVNQLLYVKGDSPAQTFELIGREYVHMVIHKPNLYHFLYLSEAPKSQEGFEAVMSGPIGNQIADTISDQLGITKDRVQRYLRNTVVYAQGIASLVATNIIHASEDEMLEMINYASDAFLEKEEKK